MRKRLPFFIIFLFGLFGLKLFVLKQLALYINKNNIWYVTLGSLACFVIGLAGMITTKKQPHIDHKKKTERSVKNILLQNIIYAPLVIALLIGLLLPAKPLQNTLFSQNFISIKPPDSAHGLKDEQIESLFGLDTSQYSFLDWMNVEAISPHYLFMNGKTVNVSGQIYRVTPTSLLVGRLYITCCTVDARPFGFRVVYLLAKNSVNPFHSGQWVRINGAFQVNNKTNEVYIIPFSIHPITSPEDPYIN